MRTLPGFESIKKNEKKILGATEAVAPFLDNSFFPKWN
jgi:hypothetical protein